VLFLVEAISTRNELSIKHKMAYIVMYCDKISKWHKSDFFTLIQKPCDFLAGPGFYEEKFHCTQEQVLSAGTFSEWHYKSVRLGPSHSLGLKIYIYIFILLRAPWTGDRQAA
jgi:hypothetical protein